MVRHVPPNGRSQTPHSGGGRDRKAPKSKKPGEEKGGKLRVEREADRGETAGKKKGRKDRKEREKMETGEERTGTNCDSQRSRGARAAVTEIRTSDEFGGDLFVYFYPRRSTSKVP